jgi:hypothetical protein
MEDADAFDSHLWFGQTPRTITQNGKTILHLRCVRCGRDFAQGLNGPGWHAAYLGILRIELLAESVNRRWLTEPCPKQLMPADGDDRAMRHA